MSETSRGYQVGGRIHGRSLCVLQSLAVQPSDWHCYCAVLVVSLFNVQSANAFTCMFNVRSNNALTCISNVHSSSAFISIFGVDVFARMSTACTYAYMHFRFFSCSF